MTIEDLLEETGGFGRFQVAIISFLFFNKFITGWSMFQMSYAGLIPDWQCRSTNPTGSNTTMAHFSSDASDLNKCQVNVSVGRGYQMEDCTHYNFSETYRTIINEWDLVCDLKWVKATVTSIQMAGLLVGALAAGQMGDVWGRKKTTYLFVLEHSLLNILTAFSVSWQMFTVCRFFIGIGIGGILVAVFPYPMEFLQIKWRPILAVLPVWALGVSVFALSAWQLNNWWKMHLVCGVCGLPGLIGIFWVPESLRWSTVQGRIKEAEDTVMKICAVNGKQMPSGTRKILEAVERKERAIRENSEKYTYLDLFREKRTAGITLIFCFQWFSFSLAYYGISFGVSSLAGNIFVNILLLATLEVPPQLASFYFNNKIGRKWTGFALIFVACGAAWACFACDISDQKGQVITGLSLVSKMGIGAAWAVMQTWGTEIYPTVTRNLGYGAANTAARIGGIAAPFIINFDDSIVASYVVIASLLVGCLVLMLVTPETKDTVLADSLAPLNLLESSSSSCSASGEHMRDVQLNTVKDVGYANQSSAQGPRNKSHSMTWHPQEIVRTTEASIVSENDHLRGDADVKSDERELGPNSGNYGSVFPVVSNLDLQKNEKKSNITPNMLSIGSKMTEKAGFDNRGLTHDLDDDAKPTKSSYCDNIDGGRPKTERVQDATVSERGQGLSLTADDTHDQDGARFVTKL